MYSSEFFRLCVNKESINQSTINGFTDRPTVTIGRARPTEQEETAYDEAMSGVAAAQRCGVGAVSGRSRVGAKSRRCAWETKRSFDEEDAKRLPPFILSTIQYQSYPISYNHTGTTTNDQVHIIFHPCNPAPLHAGQVQIISLASLHSLCLITVHRPSRPSSHFTTISTHSVRDTA